MKKIKTLSIGFHIGMKTKSYFKYARGHSSGSKHGTLVGTISTRSFGHFKNFTRHGRFDTMNVIFRNPATLDSVFICIDKDEIEIGIGKINQDDGVAKLPFQVLKFNIGGVSPYKGDIDAKTRALSLELALKGLLDGLNEFQFWQYRTGGTHSKKKIGRGKNATYVTVHKPTVTPNLACECGDHSYSHNLTCADLSKLIKEARTKVPQ